MIWPARQDGLESSGRTFPRGWALEDLSTIATAQEECQTAGKQISHDKKKILHCLLDIVQAQVPRGKGNPHSTV